MTEGRRAEGKQGEDLAADFLAKHGLRVVERNFRCPIGEIDIVAQDGAAVVFVEVRARRAGSRSHHLLAQESVSQKKQWRLTRLAQWYIKRRGLERLPARFDVIGVTWSEDGTPELSWIVNAFEACR